MSDDELNDREMPDESDMDSDDEAGTIDCPFCGKEIAEESEWCPKCGKFISREELPWSKPAWLVVGVIVTLLIVLIVWMRL